jgi:hypothetical protein
MLYVIIAFSFGLAGGVVGRLKGSSFFLWFLISGIVPVIGLIAAVLYRYEIDEPERECPNCGKCCKVYEALCMRCGCELDYPEGPATPVGGPAAST